MTMWFPGAPEFLKKLTSNSTKTLLSTLTNLWHSSSRKLCRRYANNLSKSSWRRMMKTEDLSLAKTLWTTLQLMISSIRTSEWDQTLASKRLTMTRQRTKVLILPNLEMKDRMRTNITIWSNLIYRQTARLQKSGVTNSYNVSAKRKRKLRKIKISESGVCGYYSISFM